MVVSISHIWVIDPGDDVSDQISGTWEDSLTPSEREALEAWRAGENATHAETVATGHDEYQ